MEQAIPVDKLVDDDKIIATVTYMVEDHVVKQDVYTWTLDIPTPRLIDAAYAPGDASPAFQSNTYDYILTLPVGTQTTDTTMAKQDGDLDLKIVHRSVALRDDLVVCEDCAFDTVRFPRSSIEP